MELTTCIAPIARGAQKGKPCGRTAVKSNYCSIHIKYAITEKAAEEGITLCRKHEAQGCTNIVPEEYLKRGIRTCEKHYKEQIGSDEVVFCKTEGCNFPVKIGEYCGRHAAIGIQREEAEADGMAMCSTQSCTGTVDPTMYKLCETCRGKKAERAKEYRAKKAAELAELKIAAALKK